MAKINKCTIIIKKLEFGRPLFPSRPIQCSVWLVFKNNINPGSIALHLKNLTTSSHHHPPCTITHAPTHARPSLPVNQKPNPACIQPAIQYFHSNCIICFSKSTNFIYEYIDYYGNGLRTVYI